MAKETLVLSVLQARERLADGSESLTLLSDAVDHLLCETLTNVPEAPGPWALVALGGYGRGEMCPASDVDIQFLVPKKSDTYSAFVEACLYQWWDHGFRLGYATRTTRETVALARDDHKTAMSLLDRRLLVGDSSLFEALGEALDRKVYGPRREPLLEDVFTERAERHHRFGDTVYLLEPDIKSGEGGLRDYQGVLWAAKVVGRATLKDCGLTGSELADLHEAYQTLLRFRNALHGIVGWKTDRLRFEHQPVLATMLGYASVEECMQLYWRRASTVRAFTRRVLDRLNAEERGHIAQSIHVQKSLQSADLVRLFRQSAVQDRPLDSSTLTAIAEQVPMLNESDRSDPAVAEDFFHVLTNPDDQARPLHHMLDMGLLTALIPELEPIRGLYQRNVFHVYTVDIHTLHGIAHLKQLRQGSGDEGTAILCSIMAELTSAEVNELFLALLLHDVGKGGATDEDVRRAAQRLGLGPPQVDRVCLLVREHLLLALLAQTRDLHDVSTLRHLARAVGDRHTLMMLYAMTWADMSSANPGLLTAWKASLLQQLYVRTDALMERGLDVFSDESGIVSQRRLDLLQRLLGEVPEHPTAETREIDAYMGQLPTRYFMVTGGDVIAEHMVMWRELSDKNAVLRYEPRPDQTALITVCCRDSPGLLSVLAGALATHGVNIIGAEVFGRTDGIVIDVFSVEAPVPWAKLSKDLNDVIVGPTSVSTLLRHREQPSKIGERPSPPVETFVELDNNASDAYSVLDVRAKDRPGLLYRVTRCLHRQGVNICLARVATEGHTVRDAFYIQWITGGKIADGERIRRIIQRVRDALDAPI